MLGPNITGSIKEMLSNNESGMPTTDGVFTFTQFNLGPTGTPIGNRAGKVAFDASLHDSIYTNSGSVRPLGLSLNYIIKS